MPTLTNEFSQLSTQILTRRYGIVLGLVILLLVLGYIMTLGQQQRVEDDLLLFNLITHQRMFSQKISKDALLIQAATSPQKRREAIAELKDTLTQWQQEHEQLHEVRLHWAFSEAEAGALFKELDKRHHSFYQTSQELLQLVSGPQSSPATIPPVVETILTQQAAYLFQVEQTVSHFQRLIEQGYTAYRWAKLGLLSLTIMLLLVDTFFIFQPALQKMRRAFTTTQEAEQQLLALNQQLQQKITELAQAHETYQLLVDNSLQGLIIIQGQQSCFVNQRMATMLGYDTPAELLAMSVTEMRTRHVHASHRITVEQRRQNRLQGKEVPPYYEVQIVTADGQIKWVEQYVTVIQYYGQPAVQVATIDITLRKQAETNLKEQQRFLRHLTDSLPGMIGYWNADLRCTFANQAYLTWFGRTSEQMNGITMPELMGEALFRKNEPFIRGALRGEAQNFERTLIKADGTTGYTWAQYIPDWVEGELHGFFALVTDITTIKETQAALQVSELKLRTMFELLPVGVSMLDKKGRVVEANLALEKILGLSQARLLQGDYKRRRYIHGDGSPMSPHELPSQRAIIEQQPIHEVEIGLENEQGQIVWILVSAAPLAVADLGAVVVTQDITYRKQAELALRAANEKLERLANLDGLTQIANRRQFDRYLLEQWAELARLNSSISLIMVDVDHFKLYNDTYGHLMGDVALRQVADILHQTVGQSWDLVARYGGEEFAIILPKVDEAGAMDMAHKIWQTVAQEQIPHRTSLTVPYITVSIGVSTLIPSPTLTPDILVAAADLALYQAKHQGRNQVISRRGNEK